MGILFGGLGVDVIASDWNVLDVALVAGSKLLIDW